MNDKKFDIFSLETFEYLSILWDFIKEKGLSK